MFCFSFFRIIIIILSTYCLLLFSSEQLCESLYCFLFGCRVHSLLHYQLHSTSLDQITTYTFLSLNFYIISTYVIPTEVNCSFLSADYGNINSVGRGTGVVAGLMVGYEIFSIFRDEARLSFITISICIYFRKCVALSTGYLLTKFIVLSTKIYVIFLNHPSFINRHV